MTDNSRREPEQEFGIKNPEVVGLLQRAILSHRLGRIDDAEKIYKQVLKIDKNSFDAHQLLGLVCFTNGRLCQSLEYYTKAVQLDPKNAPVHHSMGNLFAELGRHEEAISSFSSALALDTNNKLIYKDRAITLQQLGRWQRSLSDYDNAIGGGSDDHVLYNNRGIVLTQLKEYQLALSDFEKAISLNATNVEAYHNRGDVYAALEQLSKALIDYEMALGLDESFLPALMRKGDVLFRLKRHHEAINCYQTLLNQTPDDARAHNNCGAAQHAVGNLSAALESYNHAIELSPAYSEAYYNRSFILLSYGNFREGWSDHEWRLKMADSIAKHSSIEQPLLTVGSNVSGRRVYITTEQGFGDVIHFARYIPMLLQLGATVVLEAPKPLISVLETLDSDVAVVPVGSKVTDFDNYCPVMSLPYIFETNEATIPSSPYLFADRKKVKKWQRKLGPKLAKRVGLVWSGNAAHKNDHNRSIDLQQLMSLLEVPVEWHSLQKEYRAGDSELLERCALVREHQEDLTDFSDTAALIQCLDLVITVDTSVAHLAGALGKPVWILLPATPDYRWMLDRDDSPWYPSARLFRQPSDGGWGVVAASVRAHLTSMLTQQ